MLSRAQWEKLEGKKTGGEGSSSGGQNGDRSGSHGKKPQQHGSNSNSGRGKNNDWKKKYKCHNCGIKGHFAAECRKPKKERALMAEKEDEGPATLLMAEICDLTETDEHSGEVLLNEEKVHPKRYKGDAWYLDTGASNHMAGIKEKFLDLDLTVTGKVRFGDGSAVDIVGRGTVLFRCLNGEHRALANVYYIPSLKSCVIRLGQLAERGCKVVIEDDYMEIYDKARELLAVRQ